MLPGTLLMTTSRRHVLTATLLSSSLTPAVAQEERVTVPWWITWSQLARARSENVFRENGVTENDVSMVVPGCGPGLNARRPTRLEPWIGRHLSLGR